MVDVTDSKSVGGDTVWVRVPPPAPRRSKVRFAPTFFYSCGTKERHPPASLLLLSKSQPLRWVVIWVKKRKYPKGCHLTGRSKRRACSGFFAKISVPSRRAYCLTSRKKAPCGPRPRRAGIHSAFRLSAGSPAAMPRHFCLYKRSLPSGTLYPIGGMRANVSDGRSC